MNNVIELNHNFCGATLFQTDRELVFCTIFCHIWIHTTQNYFWSVSKIHRSLVIQSAVGLLCFVLFLSLSLSFSRSYSYLLMLMLVISFIFRTMFSLRLFCLCWNFYGLFCLQFANELGEQCSSKKKIAVYAKMFKVNK